MNNTERDPIGSTKVDFDRGPYGIDVGHLVGKLHLVDKQRRREILRIVEIIYGGK